MAKKPTEKQLYKLKNEWLGQFFEEVKPKEFYRAVFPEGSFERAGHFEDGKANGIITIVENDKAKNRIVFDDLSVIDEVKGAEFAVMSPVAYSGRNRTAANARWLYGIAIDLDGVEMPQLRDVFHQMNHDIIPKCTYCINSGHGLHLYYLLEKPVPLYKHLQDKLREFKYELIAKTDTHSDRFHNSKSYSKSSRDLFKFFTTLLAVLLHLFKLWNSYGKKLHNNGRCNIWCDTEGKYREIIESSTRKSIQKAESII